MYGTTKELDLSYSDAVEKTKTALAAEGFGVLTEIDVKAVLKKKLDVEFNEYIILEACNPNLAYRALQVEDDIGLLMPCNVIVYRKDDKTFVSAIKPTASMDMVGNAEVTVVAEEVEAALERVVAAI